MVVIKYKDEARENRKEQRLSINLHEFLDMLEYVDMKNGMDLKIGDNNLLTRVASVQLFSKDKEYNYCVTEIYIMPFNEKKEFIDISADLLTKQQLMDKVLENIL